MSKCQIISIKNFLSRELEKYFKLYLAKTQPLLGCWQTAFKLGGDIWLNQPEAMRMEQFGIILMLDFSNFITDNLVDLARRRAAYIISPFIQIYSQILWKMVHSITSNRYFLDPMPRFRTDLWNEQLESETKYQNVISNATWDISAVQVSWDWSADSVGYYYFKLFQFII